MSVIHVFDLDGTLWNGKHLFPDVKHILVNLRKGGHLVYIATYNTDARDILKKLGIFNIFNGGAIGPKNTKYGMLQEIMIHAKIDPGAKIFFYDDMPENIQEVRGKASAHAQSYQITAIHIKSGLSWRDIPPNI